MKRIPGMPGTSPEHSWDPGDPLGTPLGPPRTHLGRTGTPLGHLGTSLRPRARPWDPPGTSLGPPADAPWTPQGRPQDPHGRHGPQNSNSSTNRQRQELSIAVFEPACRDPSHEALDRAIFPLKRTPTSKKNTPWSRDFGEGLTIKPETSPPNYILYVYIYIYICVHICMNIYI